MSDTRSSTNHDDVHVPSARRKLPRSRGVGSGLAVLILGAWGALIPFVGPYFNFSYTPDTPWHWSAARGWLEVLPGAVAVLGGLLLLFSASRAATVFGAWLGVVAGAWFVVGLQLAQVLHIGSPGMPAGTHRSVRALESLFMFYALGALIIFFAASAFGRLSVVTHRDVSAAERRHESAIAERAAAERDTAERAAAERQAAERHSTERDRAGRAEPQIQQQPTQHTVPARPEDATHRQDTADTGDTAGQQVGYDPTTSQSTHGYDPNAPQTTRGYDPNVVNPGDPRGETPTR